MIEGWDKSWIDTVTERVVKRQLVTDVNMCKQAVCNIKLKLN